jgi:hypothetical protein
MQPDQFSPAGPLTTSPARGLLRFSSLPSLLCHRPVGPVWQTRLRRRHRTSTELSRRLRVSRADSIATFAPHLSRGFLCRLYSLATCDPLSNGCVRLGLSSAAPSMRGGRRGGWDCRRWGASSSASIGLSGASSWTGDPSVLGGCTGLVPTMANRSLKSPPYCRAVPCLPFPPPW